MTMKSHHLLWYYVALHMSKNFLQWGFSKEKTIPIEKFHSGVIIKANPRGWITEDMMIESLQEVFIRWPGGFFNANPILLIYDSMAAHLTESVKSCISKINTDLAIIPGGLTKHLQQLDFNVNKSFKHKIQFIWKNGWSNQSTASQIQGDSVEHHID